MQISLQNYQFMSFLCTRGYKVLFQIGILHLVEYVIG
jgi:hypothetical protein